MTSVAAANGAGILQRLRTATAARHAAVEQALDLLRPDFSVREYCDLLRKFHSVYSSWEPLAFSLLRPRFPDWSRTRSRIGLLEADLRHFNLEIRPVPVDLSGIATPAAALGAMYVLEGSTLGGQILSRHFQQVLGVTPESGGAFFHAYGSGTRAMWKEFGSALEDYASTTGEEQKIVAGANLMFAAVHQHVCGEAL